MGCLLSPKSGGRDYKQPGCSINTPRAATEPAFYHTGDALQLCGAEKAMAFLAHDRAAFKKAQQPVQHATRGHERAHQSHFSPTNQSQCSIGKSGILTKTEETPHTLVVAMNRCSHFGKQFSSSSKGYTVIIRPSNSASVLTRVHAEACTPMLVAAPSRAKCPLTDDNKM